MSMVLSKSKQNGRHLDVVRLSNNDDFHSDCKILSTAFR